MSKAYKTKDYYGYVFERGNRKWEFYIRDKHTDEFVESSPAETILYSEHDAFEEMLTYLTILQGQRNNARTDAELEQHARDEAIQSLQLTYGPSGLRV